MAGDSINQPRSRFVDPHVRGDLLAATGRRAWRVLLYLLAIAGAALFLLPLFFMVSSSLKPDYQILDFPPRWIPNPPRWQNYPEALTYVPFGRFTLNTLIIAAGAIIGNLLSCTLVAYGFARLRAPGKNFLFILMLTTMMLPYPVTMIPIYVEFKTLGWINTFLPLIVPAFFGSPFYIFLLRQFFLNIPRELEDAAFIDGANRVQILWRIILPISMPAIATIAIFNFQGVWNDFLPPLIYLHDQSKYTVALGLNFFRSTYTVRWGYLMAACVVTMLPMVIIFFLAQKRFIEGISLSGLKG
jgi:multiple sugar transport system permease protein